MCNPAYFWFIFLFFMDNYSGYFLGTRQNFFKCLDLKKKNPYTKAFSCHAILFVL